MPTKHEMDLMLRAILMGDAAFIGEHFVVTSFGSHGLYKGRIYKIVKIEGPIVVVEVVATGNSGGSQSSIGQRHVVNMDELKGKAQFVSKQFVRASQS